MSQFVRLIVFTFLTQLSHALKTYPPKNWTGVHGITETMGHLTDLHTELLKKPGIRDQIDLDFRGLSFGTDVNVTERNLRRAQNIQLCSRRLSDTELSANFGLNSSHLPSDAVVYQCSQRDDTYSGVVYVTNFMSVEEIKMMYSDFVPQMVALDLHQKFDNRGNIFGLASLGNAHGIRPNATAIIKKIEKRIDDISQHNVGKIQHHRFPRPLGAAKSTFLHHDGNGNCCGVEKTAKSRVFTILIYTAITRGGKAYNNQPQGQRNFKGGHTCFPFLKSVGGGFSSRDADAKVWKEIQNLYIRGHVSMERETFPAKFVATAAGRAGKKCYDAMQMDEERRYDPSLFCTRPAVGDAIFFWMKKPGMWENSDPLMGMDPHAMHVACPVKGGVKDTIQKFMQKTATMPGWGTTYHPPNY